MFKYFRLRIEIKGETFYASQADKRYILVSNIKEARRFRGAARAQSALESIMRRLKTMNVEATGYLDNA